MPTPQEKLREVQAKTAATLGQKDGDFTKSATVNKIGEAFFGAGLKDAEKPDSPENQVDEHTMFGEGSVGKVRYGGLAYMLQEQGIINLKQYAKDFFSQPEVGDFLRRKYPERPDLQDRIVGLFSQGSEIATLADILTHHPALATQLETFSRP